jgi:hypothetical protein
MQYFLASEELDRTRRHPAKGKLDPERLLFGTRAQDIDLSQPRPHTRTEVVLLRQ